MHWSGGKDLSGAERRGEESPGRDCIGSVCGGGIPDMYRCIVLIAVWSEGGPVSIAQSP